MEKLNKLLLSLFFSIPFVSAIDTPSLSSSGIKLFMQAGIAVVVLILLIILFFLSKWWRRARNSKKQYKIGAVVINRDGTWFTDKLGKFRTGDGIDKMLLLDLKESMPVIDPENIRANQCMLWRYAPGQFAVIPPKIWGKDPKQFGIEIINFQMKNFAYLEQRAAISRWQKTLSLIQQWAPYITVLLVLILGGVAIWFITKMNLEQYSEVVAARVAECSNLLSTAPPDAI
jgi:hypothetical protein